MINEAADWYQSDGAPEKGRTIAVALLIGLSLIAVSVACVVMIFLRRKDVNHAPRAAEKRLEHTLRESFPASDPPASQYFEIPINRL